MNLTLLRWLLQHRDVLTKVVEAAKKFDRTGPYIKQWDVVDEIARIVIPVFEREGVEVSSLSAEEWGADEVAAFSLGAEVHAMGVDWRQLIDVILPILITILRMLSDE